MTGEVGTLPSPGSNTNQNAMEVGLQQPGPIKNLILSHSSTAEFFIPISSPTTPPSSPRSEASDSTGPLFSEQLQRFTEEVAKIRAEFKEENSALRIKINELIEELDKFKKKEEENSVLIAEIRVRTDESTERLNFFTDEYNEAVKEEDANNTSRSVSTPPICSLKNKKEDLLEDGEQDFLQNEATDQVGALPKRSSGLIIKAFHEKKHHHNTKVHISLYQNEIERSAQLIYELKNENETEIKKTKLEFLRALRKKYDENKHLAYSRQNRKNILHQVLNTEEFKDKLHIITAGRFSRTYALMKSLGYEPTKVDKLIWELTKEIEVNTKRLSPVQQSGFFSRVISVNTISLNKETAIKQDKLDFLKALKEGLDGKCSDLGPIEKKKILDNILSNNKFKDKLSHITAGRFSRTYKLMLEFGYQNKELENLQQVTPVTPH